MVAVAATATFVTPPEGPGPREGGDDFAQARPRVLAVATIRQVVVIFGAVLGIQHGSHGIVRRWGFAVRGGALFLVSRPTRTRLSSSGSLVPGQPPQKSGRLQSRAVPLPDLRVSPA